MNPLSTLLAACGQLIKRMLHGVAWFSVFHPRSVLVVVIIVTALAGWAASGLRLSTSLDSLLPRDIETAQRMRELYDRFGGSEPVVVAISGAGEEDLDDRIEVALTLRDQLIEAETVSVFAGLFGEDPWALLDGPQAESLLLYLEPEKIDALAAELTAEAIETRVAENRRRLRSPLGPVAVQLIGEDPLGFLSLVLERLDDLRGTLGVSPREGLLVTDDGEYVLLLVRPEGQAQDVRFARRVLAEVEAAAVAALDELGIEGTAGMGPAPPEAPAGQIRVGITGAPAIMTDYHDILGHDIKSISGVAFLAVLVLFLLAFRRMTGVLIAGVPLFVGVVWSLGFARIAIGEINVFTAGSVAILCGLAIDFTIHLYNRYLEEAHAGRDMWTAFMAAHGETGLGIVAAAATTAWAFLAAGFSRFRGLRDLGLVCAAGIVLSLIASFLLVPALAALSAKMKKGPDRPRGLASFGLSPVLEKVVGHPKTVVVLGLLATVALIIPAISVRLDEDFRRFRPDHAPSIQLQRDLGAKVGTSLQPVAAIVSGDDDSALIEACGRLEKEFRKLIGDGESDLAAVLGPAAVVPPRSGQDRALAQIRALRDSGALDPEAVERELLAALGRHGFRVDDRARAAARRVRTLLSVDKPFTLVDAEQGPLAELLADQVVERPDGRRDALVSVYPRPNAKTSDLVGGLQKAVADAGVEANLIGGRVLSQELKPIVLRDGAMAVLLSAIGVMLILLGVFRRLVLVVLTFVPLVIGVIGSIGLMALFGVDFNLVSISMVPLILGIGIDNGIHVVHRFLEHSREDLAEVFRHTGRGIVMTSLTTMVGFGALIFADYPGLISSGALAILGVGATLVTAVTLLPALLRLVKVRDDARSGS